MCGFVGICSFQEDSRAWSGPLRIANRLLAHRGPDDEGFFDSPDISLGFRRLKIIDLSDKGRQPFSDKTKRHTLVFNGEIYNYVELREELRSKGYRFQTESDTEVLLNGLIEWGDACLERLNGMFAFGWWDAVEKRLVLARDRFGEKPLFYMRTKDGILFASEIKALFPLMKCPAEPNLDAIYSYLEYGDLDIAPHTFFSGVYSLRQANRLIVTENQFAESPYWELSEHCDAISNPGEKFRELFLDSLRLRSRSDVPIGTCLSGGLDSSSIVCGLSHLEDQGSILPTSRKTFSACYAQYDERPQIRAVVKQSRSQSFLTTPCPKSLSELGDLVAFHDEPFHSFATFASYSVMKLAKENGVTVVLNGQGADESLAGYGTYVVPYLVDTFFGKGILPAYRAARGSGELSRSSFSSILLQAAQYSLRSWLSPTLRSFGLRGRSQPGKCFELLDGEFASTSNRLEQSTPENIKGHLKKHLFRSLFTAKLPLYLRVEDRNSMANSMESRLPFLDHRLVEFLFRVPPWEFIAEGKNKRMLRDGMSSLLPSEVTDRKDKFGFPIPQSDWLFENLKEDVEELLENLSPEFERILQSKELLPLYKKHGINRKLNKDKGAPSQFWFRVVCLEHWFRHVKYLSEYCSVRPSGRLASRISTSISTS